MSFSKSTHLIYPKINIISVAKICVLTSVIDHVITYDISHTIFPSVFLSDISDHFPIAIIVERKNKQQDIISNLTFLKIKKNLIMIALLIICNHL